jgi:DNA-binding MarR family transcriptional regulator
MPDQTDPPDDSVQAVRGLARASRILERASGELSLAHYRVLSAVASGEERASRVAVRLALGRPTISAAVDALGQRGLIARGSVVADGRAAALSVTPAGARLLAQVEAEMARRLDELGARTPDPARLIEALTWLGSAIDQQRDELRDRPRDEQRAARA